jgi:hypothetical protein
MLFTAAALITVLVFTTHCALVLLDGLARGASLDV